MLLLGIGTLLNPRLPVARQVHILGSGVGYGDAPNITDGADVQFVRGPLSARALGIDRSFALSDPGILVSRYSEISETRSERRNIGFIPQVSSVVDMENVWLDVCGELGLTYISVREGVDYNLSKIASCERVITEAMHGAIAADSLRVPWVPIVTRPEILPFKWRDWCASMELPYEPVLVPSIYDSANWGMAGKLRKLYTIREAKNALKKVIKSSNSFLSKSAHLTKMQDLIIEKSESWQEIQLKRCVNPIQ